VQEALTEAEKQDTPQAVTVMSDEEKAQIENEEDYSTKIPTLRQKNVIFKGDSL